MQRFAKHRSSSTRLLTYGGGPKAGAVVQYCSSGMGLSLVQAGALSGKTSARRPKNAPIWMCLPATCLIQQLSNRADRVCLAWPHRPKGKLIIACTFRLFHGLLLLGPHIIEPSHYCCCYFLNRHHTEPLRVTTLH